MPITIIDGLGVQQTIQVPNSNGRAAAAASRPVALSTEDKTSLDAITAAFGTTTFYPDTQPVSAVSLPLPTGAATAAKQDQIITAVAALNNTKYETVAASATDQVLGSTGAVGDKLTGLLVVPATTSPGAVSIKDGAGAAITLFVGGATSVSSLQPFFVSFGAISSAGAWSVTTGLNVSVVAIGTFT